MARRANWMCWLLILGVVGSLVPDCPAADAVPESQTEKGEFCGLYALYTALRIEGVDTDFTNLLKSEYVGSRDGSSLAELKRAAQDFGLSAMPVSNLSTGTLAECPYLAILHTRSPADSPNYNHFILFLGAQDRRLLIYDAPTPVREISGGELAGIWDGTAVLVSASTIDLGHIQRKRLGNAGLWSIAVIASALVLKSMAGRAPVGRVVTRVGVLRSSLVQAGVLWLAATASAFGYHFFSDEGLLAAGGTTAASERAHFLALTPVVTASETRGLVNTDVVFVDARLGEDFQAGHIPGAINVPVSATAEQRSKMMRTVAKGARLIVYCESASCPYAPVVARRLSEDGFTNISIFRGGWREWNGHSLR